MLRKTSLLLCCSLASACNLTDFGSNLPDGGTCQGPSGADGGAGGARGTRGLTVASAYEVRQATGSDRERLSFALYERPTACADVQVEVSDGGSTGGAWRIGDLTVTVNGRPNGPVAAGRVEIGFLPDAGYGTVERFVNEPTGAPDGGRHLAYLAAKSGWVELDSIEPCRAAGRFSAMMDEGDGGLSALEGEFGAPYCATRR